MIADRIQFINEEFYADQVLPHDYDALLATGWRHFGEHYFRYNLGIYRQEIRYVIPLRISLSSFSLSKSQRRTLRRNMDVDVEVGPLDVCTETLSLFERHRRRFSSDAPTSILDFVSPSAGTSPAPLQLNVKRAGCLIAASFFDRGQSSLSSIFAIFDPEDSARRLGIFTMLKEIEYAIDNDITLYYHGYAYTGESFYDYKKRFSALEAYDWKGQWRSFEDGDRRL